jgi:dTDP-4-dehydrorhamnose reductase
MKKKVVIIGSAWPLRGGGIATFNERLAKQFLDEGHEVIIYTFSLQYPSFLFPGKSQYATEPKPHHLNIKAVVNSVNPFNWVRIGNEIKNYKSLVEWFRMQKKNSELKGFSDHLWNGITTYVFAEIIKTIVLKKIPLPNLIHIVPLNKTSKFELLRLFRKILNRTDITVEKVLSNKKTDRTLGTIHYSLNKLIWSKSLFKKCLNIKNIVDTLVKR